MDKLIVRGTEINVQWDLKRDDFLSLTDIAKIKDNDNPRYIIQNWLRNRNTIEFLGVWETLYNPDFNRVEFDAFRSQAGLNSFVMTPQKWVDATGAIGIVSKAGRYGGTYAHKEIAFEFASWISVEFKLYLVKEFERLKTEEMKQLGWDIKRNLAKINYRIHSHYGQEIFRGEYQKDLEGFVQILVNSRNRIAHIKSKQNRKFLNGDESVLYLHKFSLMYRIILLDLLDIPLNRYKERLSNCIETINCWWADRCDQ